MLSPSSDDRAPLRRRPAHSFALRAAAALLAVLILALGVSCGDEPADAACGDASSSDACDVIERDVGDGLDGGIGEDTSRDADAHEVVGDRCAEPVWVGAWAAAPSDAGPVFSDQTLRLLLTPLRGGERVRVRLSNRFGAGPVTFRNVHVGLQADRARLVPGSNRALTFDGATEVTVEAGADVVSDAADLSFSAFDRLAVSLYVPAPGGATRHYEGRQTSFATEPGSGDLSDVEAADTFVQTTTSRSFVVGLDVLAPGSASVVAAIGDSITDGDQRDVNGVELSIDEDARYPDHLARRLGDAPDGLSVFNLGIGGNRIAADGTLPYFGPSLLSRLEADLLWRTDVTDVIVLIGVNDLAIPPAATADEVIANLGAVVAALHEGHPDEQPLNVLVGTLTPVGGAVGLVGPLFVDAETRRADVNAAIRAGLGDGYIDFDAAVRDPADPSRLAPEFDGGDGLHLSPAGYARMAEAVDLALLRGRDCGAR